MTKTKMLTATLPFDGEVTIKGVTVKVKYVLSTSDFIKGKPHFGMFNIQRYDEQAILDHIDKTVERFCLKCDPSELTLYHWGAPRATDDYIAVGNEKVAKLATIAITFKAAGISCYAVKLNPAHDNAYRELAQ